MAPFAVQARSSGSWRGLPGKRHTIADDLLDEPRKQVGPLKLYLMKIPVGVFRPGSLAVPFIGRDLWAGHGRSLAGLQIVDDCC